jgi:hypothetical protein
MEPKSRAAARLPIRRGLGLAEAALYVGLGSTSFLELVKARRMPTPRLVGARRIWDMLELDLAFDELPHEGENATAPPSTPAQAAWENYRRHRNGSLGT